MAVGTVPRDFVRQVSIDQSTWTEIKVQHQCLAVSVRQLGSETQQGIKVKHRSDDVGEDFEWVDDGQVWEKGMLMGAANPGAKRFQVGDTIGFFQSETSGITLVVREYEV